MVMPRKINIKLYIPLDIGFIIFMIKCQSCIFYTFVITGPNGRLIYHSIQAADMRTLTSIQLKCPKDSAVDDAFLIYDKPQSIHVLWVIGVV